ncbi:helix-turn-helix domain-containing protein [Paenibacillus beijingensis]|uniref:GAF domain-containing protein n=1 Tax=Paenibacillus beijingensis TaxID=1126833 RepID=A0A0D5NH61_9BACL|nr:helix-turn-helix domain-containing protein [Paenibacillus beijingensis]AJY74248.1 hypothetical protein VN24_06220 [Paenibacillus beijingensis]
MADRSFLSLMRIARTIVSSINEEQMLDLILQSAIDAIPAADTGFLFLYDARIRKLAVHSVIGFDKSASAMTRLSPGEGISGRTFMSEKPMFINGKENIRSAMANMTELNHKYYLDSTIYANYPNSCIAAPLMYGGQCIGVLTIDNFASPEPFGDEDLILLQGFADLAAVVLERNRLFLQVQKQNRELQMTHEALRKEHERLQITIDFHNRLSHLAAKGQGTPEILAALYHNIKVPVAVYDPLLTPVAKLPEGGDFRLPDHFLQHPAMQWVQRNRNWQRIDLPEGGGTLLVTPIVGAERLLGYLCARTGPEGFVDAGKLIFEYSATVLALDWVKKEAVRESQARVKDAFLEDVLAGEMNVQLQEQARYLGLEKDSYYAVLLTSPMEMNVQTALEQLLQRMPFQYLSVERSQRSIMILSLPAAMEPGERQSAFRALLYELQRMRTIEGGIGRLYQGLDRVSRSYLDAQQSARLLDKRERGRGVIYFGDLGIIRFLIRHNREELEEYLRDVLDPIMAYDREKNTSLLQTLLAFVKNDKDLRSTTQELSIHHNTLYYRIGRIRDLLGYAFDEGDDWFNVKMACHIHRYLGEDENGP